MTWLPDAERIPNARSGGGTYIDAPWRFVTHTTEVIPSGVSGARGMAARHEYPPHLWAWPERDWLAQTVPLDRSAFALLHPAGTPHTNKMRAIQVEIIGHAGDTPTWPADWWDWLGERVLRPIVDAGYPINLDRVAPTTGTDGYGTDGAVRMTWDQWRSFDGICSHSNVPGNSHWDIGAGRLDRIAAAAKGPARPPKEAPLMALTDKEQSELLDRVRMLTPFGGERINRSGVRVAEGGFVAHPTVRYAMDTLRGVQALDVPALAEALAARLPGTAGPVKITDLEEALRNVLGSLDEDNG